MQPTVKDVWLPSACKVDRDVIEDQMRPYPTQEIPACCQQLMVNNPLRQKAIIVSCNSRCRGVQLCQDRGLAQGLVAIVGGHAAG